MIKKAMISQPMAGKDTKEIIATRTQAFKALRAKGYDIADTLFSKEKDNEEALVELGVTQTSLWFLAKSLEAMSKCHAVYFCKGWESARGCRLEHEVAKTYGLEIIYGEKE